jgi:hypoxanthine phosphoribosyltransferase
MAKKLLISPEQYYLNCFKLAKAVVDSGYRPNVVYDILRGGATVGNVMYEVFSSIGWEIKLAAVLTQSYYGTEQNKEKIVKIAGYTLPPDEIYEGSKILLIEDLCDSGRSLGSVIFDILDQNPLIKRENIQVAVLDYKVLRYESYPPTVKFRRLYEPDRKKIYEVSNPFSGPDFWVNQYIIKTEEENPWISYPHEIIDLSLEEIYQNMGRDIMDIVKSLEKKNSPVG